MRSIYQVLDPGTALSMPLEDLAHSLLTLARENEQQNGLFHPGSFLDTGTGPTVAHQTRAKVERAVMEALTWLESEILVARDVDTNGSNGWRFVTRRGTTILERDQFKSYQAAAAFPKSLLHPTIAEEVWADLARSDFPTAVFRAFKAVEEAVRKAAGLADEDTSARRSASHPVDNAFS